MRKTLTANLLLSTGVAAASLCAAAPAHAQIAEPVEGAAPQSSADMSTPPNESIVITGSRIARPDLEVASPVNVIGQEEIQLRQPNSAEDLLRDLPSVRPALGPSVNNGSNGSATVNLRGIGDNRTLVLLDGRRVVPFSLDGTVDLNVMPIGLVERVDVVTGGASSVYGADAVAGVVNFITRRNFSGVDLQANYRISEMGDAAQYRLNAVIGHNFLEDRGNVVLAVGYGERNDLLTTDREIARFPISSTTGLFAGSLAAVPTVFTAPGNAALGLPASSFGAVVDPGTGLLRAGTAADTYNTNINTYFITPLTRLNAYAGARLEINDHIEAYATGLYAKNEALIQLASSGTFSNTYRLSLNNPYLTPGIRNQLCGATDTNPAVAGIQPITPANCAAAGAAQGGPGTPGYIEIPVIAQRRFTEYGPRGNPIDSEMFQIQAGLRGKITGNIRYDLSGQYGETSQTQLRENWGSSSKVQQALRAFRNTAGQPVCTNTANNCVPLNIFGPEGSITPDQIAFIDLDARIDRLVTQSVVTGSVNGDLFGLRSPLSDSPVGFAIGAEYREVTATARPDAPSQIQGEVLGTGARTPPDFGSYDVKEVFGEILIPLITDSFIHNLTLEAGVRLSDYSTTGSSTTWKVGGTLEPIRGFRARGMYQVAVRSPNILELYQAPVQALSNLTIDPCGGPSPTASRALCEATGAPGGAFGNIPQPSSGQINTTTSGNALLDVEKAKTYTIGAVISPDFLKGFAFTVDYFNIRVEDAISSPTQNDILNGCYSQNFNPSQTPNNFCQLIGRNPLNGSLNGQAETPGVILGSSNLGTIETAGVDIGLTYRMNLGEMFGGGGDPGRLTLGFNATWLDYYNFQATPISINRDCTGYYSTSCTNPRPEWKWNARATYQNGPAEVSLLWTHISSVEYEPIAPSPLPALDVPQPGTGAATFNALRPEFREIETFNYFDLAMKFNVTETFEMSLLVENLFNKKPPLVGSGVGGTTFNNGNTFPSVYDPIGRAYTVAARLKF
ncbi:MAG TPA: TonB-dependent receptor [Allosphingosinicella sp.]|nr:TonB-dependent receptor [Allosphingosinicella sp.]